MKEYLNFVDGSNFKATPTQNDSGKVCNAHKHYSRMI